MARDMQISGGWLGFTAYLRGPSFRKSLGRTREGDATCVAATSFWGRRRQWRTRSLTEARGDEKVATKKQVIAIFGPVDEEEVDEMSLATLFEEMEKEGDPMLRSELDVVLEDEEAKREVELALEQLSDESYTAESIRAVLAWSSADDEEQVWEAAVNAFNRNVAFRANRISNPEKIAGYYIQLCSAAIGHCAALRRRRVFHVASVLASVGIPPSYITCESTPLFVYDPSQSPPESIVLNCKDDCSYEHISIDVYGLTTHIVTNMLDIKMGTNDTISPAMLEELLYGDEFGSRISPHAWHSQPVPEAWATHAARDMVLAVLRVGLQLTLIWQELIRVPETFLGICLTVDHDPFNPAIKKYLPSPRSTVNALAPVIGSDPDFDGNGSAIWEPYAISQCLFARSRARTKERA